MCTLQTGSMNLEIKFMFARVTWIGKENKFFCIYELDTSTEFPSLSYEINLKNTNPVTNKT